MNIPYKLWCWTCPSCCHANVMGTIASTIDASSMETCEKCGTIDEVQLPE